MSAATNESFLAATNETHSSGPLEDDEVDAVAMANCVSTLGARSGVRRVANNGADPVWSALSHDGGRFFLLSPGNIAISIGFDAANVETPEVHDGVFN